MRTYYGEFNWLLTPIDAEKADMAGFDAEEKHFLRVSTYFKDSSGEKPSGYYIRFEINPHHYTKAELAEEHLLLKASRRAYSQWCEARSLAGTVGCKKLASLLEKIGMALEPLREGDLYKACALPFVSDDEFADPKNTAILVSKYGYKEIAMRVETSTIFPKSVTVLRQPESTGQLKLADAYMEIPTEKILYLKNYTK